MSLLHADGYFPFCIPTEVDGKDIELWDGETTFEEGGIGEQGPFGQTLASNSSSEYIPVVGNGCGWVEISLETAMKLYWRARLLDFAQNEIVATLTAKTQYQTVEAEVTATKIAGTPKATIQNESSLVCSKQNPWESLNSPKFYFEATMAPFYGGAPDFPFLGNFPIDVGGGGGIIPFVNGSVVINDPLVDNMFFRVGPSYITGSQPLFRQIKNNPDKVYVAISSIIVPTNIEYITSNSPFGYARGGVVLVADELVGRKDFGNQSFFSSMYELSDQSATFTILGESNSVKIMKYGEIDYYPSSPSDEAEIEFTEDGIMAQYPTPFTYPDIEIVVQKYFTYGGIYNEDTGEQV